MQNLQLLLVLKIIIFSDDYKRAVDNIFKNGYNNFSNKQFMVFWHIVEQNEFIKYWVFLWTNKKTHIFVKSILYQLCIKATIIITSVVEICTIKEFNKRTWSELDRTLDIEQGQNPLV